MNSEALHVFITAGEASGDILGARLMKAIRKQAEGRAVRFSGIGGPAMQAEGLKSLFPMTELSVMGLAEILPRLRKILARIRQTADAILTLNPGIVVTVDSPDFSFRVARLVKAKAGSVSPKMVHYAAPTVWAWRPGRAAKVAALYDGIVCLFPFEPPYFEREGMKACFAGHPAAELAAPKGNGVIFRRQHGIPDGVKVLGVLFGSRAGEIRRMGRILRATALEIAARHPDLEIVAPTLPHLAPQVAALLRHMPCGVHISADPAAKADAFAAMDGAVAVSGTVGLELALAGTPHVIGYRMSPLTWQVVRRAVKVKYAHLANILLDAPVVPEFIQGACTAGNMAEALEKLWADDGGRGQKREFEQLHGLLSDREKDPSEKAAAFILEMAAASS